MATIMPKLPATVTAVTRRKAALYEVTVAFWDGTIGTFIVPDTLATYEGVRIAAQVFAQLMDNPPYNPGKPRSISRGTE